MSKTVRANLFMRYKRFRKKLHLNMMGLKVLFDVTTAIYSLILVAYLVAAFFITNDEINEMHDSFIMIEAEMRKHFWFILTVLPFRYVMQSFQSPGIIFSTSEHKLSMLPFARIRVWLFACVVKWARNALIYFFLGGIVGVLTPISYSLIIDYIIILFGYDVLFTVPVWKLFHERLWIKFAVMGGMLFFSICTYLLESPIIGLLIPLVLIGIHIPLMPQLFKQINWGRVTEVSDFKIWNMPLISRATKTSFKRSKRYSIFRQSRRRRKPFQYTHQAIHRRLWMIYFGENITLIAQSIGSLLVLLTVLAFAGGFYFQIGVAIALYVYANVSASFFRDRFQSDILRALPWELTLYKQTFFKWVLFGGSFLLIPIVIFGIIHWSIWQPLNWVLYGCVFLSLYHIKIDKSITILARRLLSLEWSEGIGFLFLIVVIGSGFYPILSFWFILCIIFLSWHKQHFHTLFYLKGESVT